MTLLRMVVPNTRAGHNAMLFGAAAVVVPSLLLHYALALSSWILFVALAVAAVVPVHWGATTLRLTDGRLLIRPVGIFSRELVQPLAGIADAEVVVAYDEWTATRVVLTLVLVDGRSVTFGPWGRMSRGRLERLRAFVDEMKRQLTAAG